MSNVSDDLRFQTSPNQLGKTTAFNKWLDETMHDAHLYIAGRMKNDRGGFVSKILDSTPSYKKGQSYSVGYKTYGDVIAKKIEAIKERDRQIDTQSANAMLKGHVDSSLLNKLCELHSSAAR